MLSKLETIGPLVGNTPLVKLRNEKVNLYTKLEYQNLMNSVKARAAFYVIKAAVERGELNENSTVIESSSGNYAIALATMCKYLGIKFIPVIDSNINRSYENILNSMAHQVVKVTERDHTGGYLLSRLDKVGELCAEIPHAFWTNQYGNQDNFHAHYHGIGLELANQFDKLDYAFIGVSTGGTIAGVSRRLKEKFPAVRIIALDTEGSVIFGDKPKKRYIPGIGSSIVPDLIQEAVIDEVLHIREVDTVEGCYRLFQEHALFAGGSSGTSYFAIQQYFEHKEFAEKPNVVFLCPDGGAAYADTIYSQEWVRQLQAQQPPTVVV